MKLPILFLDVVNWFRKPRPIIQTRASHKAFREAESERRKVHSQLARECGLPDRWGRGHA